MVRLNAELTDDLYDTWVYDWRMNSGIPIMYRYNDPTLFISIPPFHPPPPSVQTHDPLIPNISPLLIESRLDPSHID